MSLQPCIYHYGARRINILLGIIASETKWPHYHWCVVTYHE